MLPPPADWVVPERTVVIATLQRSGSNYLADLMGRTGRLGRPAEFFNPHAMRTVYPGRGGSAADSCRLAIAHGRSANGVVGIKLFPEHLITLSEEIRFSQWFGAPRWLWLRRRDVLGQAISLVMARQRDSFIAGRDVPEPVYAAEAIIDALREISQRDARWRAYFGRTGIEPLRVVYEEVERDPAGALAAIATYAGVAAEAVAPVGEASFTRQRTALNEEWRVRFIKECGDPDVLSFGVPRRRGWLGRMFMRGVIPPKT